MTGSETQAPRDGDECRSQAQQESEAVKPTETTFRLLMEHTPAPVAMFDRSMRYLVVSRRWLEDYRLGDRNIIGLSHYEVFPEVPERWKEIHRRCLAGETLRAEEDSFVRSDGRRDWVRWEMCPWTNEAGEIGGVIIFSENITGLKEAVEELRQREGRLSSLIQATQDAVIFIDATARITRFNPAAERLFGYPEQEILGQKVEVLMPEPYASEHHGYLERYERTREPHAIGRIRTVTAKRKSGARFPIELSVTEVRADGEVRYAALIRDISEKVRLEQQLLERERLAMIGTTTSMFAHEVGNPLNGLYVQAQLMQRRLSKHGNGVPDGVRKGMSAVMAEIERMKSLLEEFRQLSRRQQVDLAPMDLCSVVRELHQAEGPGYEGRGVRTERVVPKAAPVLGDPHRLRQALLNLCKNAVEAMPEGGTLTMRVLAMDDSFRLEVQDTGNGIPEDADVFQPFHTTKPGGTGLGLPVVKEIVTAHGGRINYESRPGAGTTFSVVFPAASAGVGT